MCSGIHKMQSISQIMAYITDDYNQESGDSK
jgi:hypothetical protein